MISSVRASLCRLILNSLILIEATFVYNPMKLKTHVEQ